MSDYEPDQRAAAMDDRESRLRSFLKAISYRVTGTLITALLVWYLFNP